MSLEQLGSLEAHHGGSVCCTVGSGHCLGAQLLLSGSPQVMLCPEVALLWTDLAAEWLPETEAPIHCCHYKYFVISIQITYNEK